MRKAVEPNRLEQAYQTARAALLAERTPEGHWVGELSTSALSTAVAVSALALVGKTAPNPHSTLIAGGLSWLAGHQNADGGWGDTLKSFSNISTTMLCRSAFHLTGTAGQHADCLHQSDAWLAQRYGSTPEQHAEAVRARYGQDRTFSVPILMTAALAGLVSWREVPALPFELATLPQSWFRFARLPVVSYALPALIAIGQAVHHHRRSRNPLARLVRRLAINRSLKVLEKIQPSNGGFLEAAPLTGFVALGLASTGRADHPVVRRCVNFLVSSVRPDGSWPIDTNLATWVTTLAVNALAAAGELGKLDRLAELCDWLRRQQYRERHQYTGAAPGGWAWTDLPGGVPDADDTPGALLAMANLVPLVGGDPSPLPPTDANNFVAEAARPILQGFVRADRQQVVAFQAAQGVGWLLDLQNTDGGWPTFCRGWGKLPFDRSGSDLTAHALRALDRWGEAHPGTKAAVERGLSYLAHSQNPDGSWLPLWFGNQHAPDDGNPTYGTARVLAAYRDLTKMSSEPARRGIAWLLASQNADGGWGGAANTPSSVEETALAVEVLLDVPGAEGAVNKGLAWLVQQVEAGQLHEPAPMGFYFAKLWYFEKLYPAIFTVAALGRARRLLSPPTVG
jgi:squalene-hopene/tetraprenyl-beta-curcumene cyclase